MKRKLSCNCNKNTQCNSESCSCFASSSGCSEDCGCGNPYICRLSNPKKRKLSLSADIYSRIEIDENKLEWKKYYYKLDDKEIYFGIRQIKFIELPVRVGHSDKSSNKMSKLERYIRKMAENNSLNPDTKEPWLRNTRDSLKYSKKDSKFQIVRDKFFFPKYSYGKTNQVPKSGQCTPTPIRYCKVCKGNQEIVCDECDNIPKWIQKKIIRTLVYAKIIPDEWVNEVVVNIYHNNKAGLVSHFDSPHLFDRLILSLRLCEKATMIFNSSHQTGGKNSFKIELPAGYLTIMEGDAANLVNHAIARGNRKSLSASILMRHVHDELLTEKWKKKNCIKWFEPKVRTKG